MNQATDMLQDRGPSSPTRAVVSWAPESERRPGVWVSWLDLAALPGAVSWARRHVGGAFAAWGCSAGLVDDMVTVTSELVTNAVRSNLAWKPEDSSVRQASVSYMDLARVVRLSVAALLLKQDHAVQVEVFDPDPRLPVQRGDDPLAEFGRGLVIVEELSKAWGYFPVTGGGKVVWSVMAYE